MILPEFERQLKKKVAAKIEELKDNLAHGGASSFEAYHRKVGKIEGLSEIQELVRETLKQMEVDADE